LLLVVVFRIRIVRDAVFFRDAVVAGVADQAAVWIHLEGVRVGVGNPLREDDDPTSLRRVTSSFPSARLRPRLVKICTTPLAASEP